MLSRHCIWIVLKRCSPFLLAGAILWSLPGYGLRPAPAVEPAVADPLRLAVLLVFDQFRGDYLSRWEKLFGEHGFRRLQTEGAWFTNCHYPYALTFTGSGHASILTGCSPAEHGIIGNEWYDRVAGERISCVDDTRYMLVRGRADPAGVDRRGKSIGLSPTRMLTPTVGDALKEATGGKSRVVGLSLKDRSAMLPAGHRADAAYWFDSNDGTFITSTYYVQRQQAWADQLNRERFADQWFGRDWVHVRAGLDYVPYSGPADVEGADRGFGQGRAFPHPLTGGRKVIGKEYFQALANSPFGNDLLLELTRRAIEGEQLGRHSVPDLLTVSFSSNDAVGHCWGPDSQEVLDITLRSDQIVADLLALLDDKVGKGHYILALTADHGVCPLPEVARAQGKDGARDAADTLTTKAEAFLNSKFGNNQRGAHWLSATEESWVYLNRQLLRERGLQQAEVEYALAKWLKVQPGILEAYTRTGLLSNAPSENVFQEQVRRSFYPDRSGDVGVILKPYHLMTAVFARGTTHGTPHDYDTHVPLLVMGPGIRPGVHPERITPQATAAILARGLGIKPPATARAPLPDGLFSDR